MHAHAAFWMKLPGTGWESVTLSEAREEPNGCVYTVGESMEAEEEEAKDGWEVVGWVVYEKLLDELLCLLVMFSCSRALPGNEAEVALRACNEPLVAVVMA